MKLFPQPTHPTDGRLMPAIYLNEDDVRELMDMETSIEVVEEAFRQLAEGKAVNVPRVRAKAGGVILHNMSAGAEYLGLVGFKAYTTTRAAARFHVVVYDSDGELVAMIAADYLGQLRTGAASGVATEFMARPDAKVVGVFGTGRQARTQLKAVCTVRKIEQVEVYSPNADHQQQFAEEMAEWCVANVVPVHSPEECAAEKDILIAATSSKTPVFDGAAIDEGTHLNVVGSNFLSKAEVDAATLRRADHIVCDSVAQCRLEAGDLARAVEEGIRDWSSMHDLAEIITGRETGRATPEDVTLFKSVGLAIEDVAMGAEIVKRARAAGLGRELPF
jgi:ornithine cyclodeaminase/alanine dehydrogenase-like protein (mu-crystallin family)